MNGFSLGRHAEVYDAEVMGICGGRDAAVTSPMIGSASSIHMYLHGSPQRCTTSRNNTQWLYPGWVQKVQSRLQKTGEVKDGKSRFNGPRPTTGIKGNDIADVEAKKGHAGNTHTVGATEEVQCIH